MCANNSELRRKALIINNSHANQSATTYRHCSKRRMRAQDATAPRPTRPNQTTWAPTRPPITAAAAPVMTSSHFYLLVVDVSFPLSFPFRAYFMPKVTWVTQLVLGIGLKHSTPSLSLSHFLRLFTYYIPCIWNHIYFLDVKLNKALTRGPQHNAAIKSMKTSEQIQSFQHFSTIFFVSSFILWNPFSRTKEKSDTIVFNAQAASWSHLLVKKKKRKPSFDPPRNGPSCPCTSGRVKKKLREQKNIYEREIKTG